MTVALSVLALATMALAAGVPTSRDLKQIQAVRGHEFSLQPLL